MSDSIAVEDHVLSDAELITAVRRGDTAAFGVLFARHSAAATAVARRYLQGSDADDAVAGAFEKVLAVLRAGKGPDVAFRAYLFTVVRRRAVEMLEGGRRAAPTDDDHVFESAVGPLASSEDPALKGFEDRTVARAFQALPERWRSVLWYTDIEGRAPAEVAPALGMTPNAVSALAYRAREGLRQAYLQAHLADVADDDGCARTNAQLGAYVRGGLSRRESTRVEEHLESCARCRAVALELADLAVGMRATVAPLVVGLLGVAALGGLPLVLTGAGAGAAAAGAGGGGESSSGSTAVGAGVGALAGVSAAGAAGGAAAGGAAAGGAAAGGAAAGGGAAAVASGAAGVGSRWFVGAAAGVAVLLVAGGLGLGAGWLGDDGPPGAAPPTQVAPSAPSATAAPGDRPTPPSTTPDGSTPSSGPGPQGPTVAPAAVPPGVPTGRPGQGPTQSPSQGPTTPTTDAPADGPTVSPSPSPTTLPSPSPFPTDDPTTPPTEPTDDPTTPEAPAAQPPVVTVGSGTVLVAGSTGTLDVDVERPAAPTEPLTLRLTLPTGATWVDDVLSDEETSAGWQCASDGPRDATCTLEPRPPTPAVAPALLAPALLAPVALRTSADATPTVTDTVRLVVGLDAAVAHPGELRVEASSGDGPPARTSLPLGAALAVTLDAVSPGTADGTLVLRPTAATGTMTLDVTNAGRPLDDAVVELVVPDVLAVAGDRCMGNVWAGGTTTLRCPLGPLDAGETRTLNLDVTSVPDAPLTLTTLPATLTATAASTSHDVDAHLDVQVDTERAQLRARFEGRYRAYEIGAPTLHCDTGATACLRFAEDDTANNDNTSLRRVALDGKGGRPTSTSTLTLPAGARVAGAYLTWGASYSGVVPGTEASRAAGTLTTPDGRTVSVAGSSVLGSDLFGRDPLSGHDFFRATADVTEHVQRAGAGRWTFWPGVGPQAQPRLFGGWSLVVVVEDPAAPNADVRVYDALEILTGKRTSALSFATDRASDVRLGVTVWEGDRGIAGDKVVLDNRELTPVGGLAAPRNAFDSTAAGFEVPGVTGPVNSFGVDVRGFVPAAVEAGTRTLTFGTEDDSYALAAFTLTLTPR